MNIEASNKERLDALELELRKMEQVDCPLLHVFTPGLYTRQIFMPAGTLIVSKEHRLKHPFIISKGTAYVKNKSDEWEKLEAPYIGTTEPGTRRVLLITESCIWSTFHVSDLVKGNENELPEDEQLNLVEAIENVIIQKSDNPLLAPLKKEVISQY